MQACLDIFALFQLVLTLNVKNTALLGGEKVFQYTFIVSFDNLLLLLFFKNFYCMIVLVNIQKKTFGLITPSVTDL